MNLDPTIGDEIRKKRPVVVLNPGHLKHLKLAIVVPVTGWNSYWDENPFFISLEPDIRNGLSKRSVIDCYQIRAISHGRLTERIGSISPEEIALVRKAISLILDIEPDDCA